MNKYEKVMTILTNGGMVQITGFVLDLMRYGLA